MRDRIAAWSGSRRRGAWVLPQAETRPARLLGGLAALAAGGVLLLAVAGAALRALRLHGSTLGVGEMPLTAVAIAAGLVALGGIAWAILNACAVAVAAVGRGLRS